MNYKLLSVLVIISTLFTMSFGCVFMEDSEECVVAEQGSNIYEINVDELGAYKQISALIIPPGTGGERFNLELIEETGNSVKFFQSRPFRDFGVHILRINVLLEDEITQLTRDFQILYDFSVPMPPVIESMGADDEGNNLIITGFVNNPALEGDVLVYVDGGSNPRIVQVQEDGSFQISNIPHSDTLRLELTHRIQRQHNLELVESARNKQIYYSEAIRENHFEDPRTAFVNFVDFIGNNPHTFSQTGGKIVTFTPHYYISGTATDGDIVYIQGTPVPVINNRFHTYVLLNEEGPTQQGTEISRLCVVGRLSSEQQPECREFEVIYSHAFGDNPFSLIDKDTLRTLNLNTLSNREKVSQLQVQGINTPAVSNVISNPIFSQIDQNLFLVEVKYPGLHEYQYLMVDSQSPQIEFLTNDDLFMSSRIGLILRDDTMINLESFELHLVGTPYILTEEGAVTLIDQGGSKMYMEFKIPEGETLPNLEVTARVDDVYGNSGTATTQLRTVNTDFSVSNDLIVNLQSQGRMIGNKIFMRPEVDEIRLELVNKNPQQNNMPITTGILRAGNEIISSFTHTSNRELQVRVDSQLLRNAPSNLIELELNLFRSLEDSLPSRTITKVFEVEFLEREVDSSKIVNFVANNVDVENIIIVKFETPFIDYSTFNLPGNIHFKGNYGFINLDSPNTATVSYSDLAGNSYSFQVSPMINSNLNLNHISTGNEYNTLRVTSNNAYHFFDLFMSSRSNNLLSSGIRTGQNVHYNPLYLEGISKSLFSVFDNSNRQTVVFSTPVQSQFSFDSYPTSSFEYHLGSGINQIQFRGYRTNFNSGETTTIIQGRVLGDEDIAYMSIRYNISETQREEVECLMEERFFICEVEIEKIAGQPKDFEFRDSGGNPVIIGYNTLSLNVPTTLIDGGTSSSIGIENTAYFYSGLGDDVDTTPVSDLISCRRVISDDDLFNSDLIDFEEVEGSGNITVFRETSDEVYIELECSVTYNSITSTKSFVVGFKEVPEEESVLLFIPGNIDAGTITQISGSINATNFRGSNLTEFIVCSSASTSVEVTQTPGVVNIERLHNNSIESTINCFVEDPITLDNASGSFEVTFDKINDMSLVQLHVQELIFGKKNQQIALSNPNFRARYGPNPATSYVSCFSDDPSLVIANVEGSNLVITRLSNDSIAVELTCQLSYQDYDVVNSTSIVLFDKVNPPGGYQIDLSVNSPLNGRQTNRVFDEISAIDSDGDDITSQVVCDTDDALSNNVFVVQNHSPLIVEREILEEINTFVTCSVSNRGVTEIVQVGIMFEDATDRSGVTISAQTPLTGGIKNSVTGSIEARLGDDPVLTEYVECTVPNPSQLEYDIDSNQNSITVIRLVSGSFVQTLTCSYIDDDDVSVSTEILVSFDSQPEPPVFNVHLVPEQDLYEESGMLFSKPIVATLNGEDILDDIECGLSDDSPSSMIVDIVDGNLTVERDFNEEVLFSVICKSISRNEDLQTFHIEFEEFTPPPSPLVLHVKELIHGGDNQHISLSGSNFMASYNSELPLHNNVQCFSSTGSNINHRVDSNNNLIITRTSNQSIVTQLTCRLIYADYQPIETTSIVLFNRVNDPDLSYQVNLDVSSSLHGGKTQKVFDNINVIDSNGQDLTSQVSCSTHSLSSGLFVAQSHSPLIIQRSTNDKVHSFVTCMVSNEGVTEIKHVEVLFDNTQGRDDGFTVSVESPLSGRTNNFVIGSIEARYEGNLVPANTIRCNVDESKLTYSIDSAQNSITITRVVETLISQTVTCEYFDINDVSRASAQIQVSFSSQLPPELAPIEIRLDPQQDLYIESGYEFSRPIIATSDGVNVLGDISCDDGRESSSLSVSVDITDGNLVVTRDFTNEVTVPIVCSSNSRGEEIETFHLIFDEIPVPLSPLTLKVQEIILGGKNQEVTLSGSEFVAQYQTTGFGTINAFSFVSCEYQGSEIDVNVQGNSLIITRNTDESIVKEIECTLNYPDYEPISTTSIVLFDKINSPTLSYKIELDVSNPLHGRRTAEVFDNINAIDSNEQNLTSSITCSTHTLSTGISVSQSNSPLHIVRNNPDRINTFVTCSVTNEGVTEMRHIGVKFSEVGDRDIGITVSAQDPLSGRDNNFVIGSIEGRFNGNLALTQDIECNIPDSNELSYSINHAQSSITVTRLVQDPISQILGCSYLDSDGNPIDTANIRVSFGSQLPEPLEPIEIRLEPVESLYQEPGYEFSRPITATSGGEDVLDDISCRDGRESPSLSVTVNITDGNLVVIRDFNDEVTLPIICSSNSRNEDIETFNLKFKTVVTPVPPLVLEVKELIHGGDNQEIKLGGSDFRATYNSDFAFNDRVQCYSSLGSNINHRVDSENNLVITRTSNESIVTELTCRLAHDDYEPVYSTSIVLFNKVNSPDLTYQIELDVSSPLHGRKANRVFDNINAIDSNDVDLSSQITCNTHSLSKHVSVFQSQNPLIIQRESIGKVHSFVTCTVSNEGVTEIKHVEVLFSNIGDRDEGVSISAESPLSGRTNDFVIGSIEGRLNGNLDLTGGIECTISNPNELDYDIDSQQHSIRVTRLVESAISQTLVCEYRDINDVSRATTEIQVSFSSQSPPELAPIEIRLDPQQDLYIESGYEFSKPITATSGGVDVLDDISCDDGRESPSLPVSVNITDENLVVTRDFNDEVTVPIICSSNSREGEFETFNLEFERIPTSVSPLVLHVKELIHGGNNQEIKIGGLNFRAIYNSMIPLHNKVECYSSLGSNINHRVDDENNLVITRTSNESIVTELTCRLEYRDYEPVYSTSIVLFNKVNSPELSYQIELDVSSPLHGRKANRVFDNINAIDSNDVDLTSQISCNTHSLSNGLSVVQSKNPLIIQRQSDENIHSFVTCTVSNEGVTETKHVEVLFDNIGDRDEGFSISAESPLSGRTNNFVIGSIEARYEGNLVPANTIRCNVDESKLTYSIDSNQNSITITRLVQTPISQTVTCEYFDVNDISRTSAEIQVSFSSQLPPELAPIEIRLDPQQDLYIESGYEFSRPIIATSDGVNVLGDISCDDGRESSSLSVSVDITDGNLVVTRDFTNEVTVPIVCSSNSRGEEIETFHLLFNEIQTPPSSLILEVQGLINGGNNQEISIGGSNFRAQYNSISLHTQVTCTSPMGSNINHRVDEENNLIITRTSNETIVTELNCRLVYDDYEPVHSTSIVLFNKVNDPSLDYQIELDVSSPLNGRDAQQVFDDIEAIDSNGNDLTSQISCNTHSLSTDISVVQSHSPLIIRRESNGDVHSFVTCSVSNEGVTEMKHVEVLFDDIGDRDFDVTISAESPLSGGTRNFVTGSIEGRLDGNLILTNGIRCTIPNENELTHGIDSAQHSITITRLVETAISQTLTCTYRDEDGVLRASAEILVSFSSQDSPPEIIEIYLTPQQSLYHESEYTFSRPITATLDGEDILDDIECRNGADDSSLSLSVNITDENLVVTRDFDNRAVVPIICASKSRGQDLKTFFVEFEPIVIATNYLHLTVSPSQASGGDSQSTIVEVVAIFNGYDVTNSVTCSSGSNEITLNRQGNDLTITRTTNISIDATLNCEVSQGGLYNSTETQVLFNRVNDYPPGTEERLFLYVPSSIYGGQLDTAIGLVTANNSNGDNLTSQIECIAPTSSSPITVTQDNSPLIVSRNNDLEIQSYVKCSISQEPLLPEEKFIEVYFEEKEDGSGPPPTPQSVTLEAQPLILGGEMDSQVGHLRAYLTQSGVDITDNIRCTNLDPQLISFERQPENKLILVTRLTDSLINSSRINCSIDESGSQPREALIEVNFDAKPQPPEYPVVLTFGGGTNVQEDGLTYTTSITAIKGPEIVTNDIECNDFQDLVNADIIDSVLYVTRSTTNALVSNVECVYVPRDELVNTLRIEFNLISTPSNVLSLIAPTVLPGGKSNSVLGGISATFNQIDVTNLIECQDSANLQAEVTANNELKVTRLTDLPISEYITCEIRDNSVNPPLVNTSQTFVVFDSINPPGVNLYLPLILNGGEGNTVQDIISANNSQGFDLTSQITCEVISQGNTISIISEQGDSFLVIQRETDDRIDDGVVRCQVTSGGITESGHIIVNFDEKQEPPITQTIHLYAESPIEGGTRQKAAGSLEAYIIENEMDLTSNIMCENFAQSQIIFERDAANKRFTVQRLTNNSITSAIVRCSINQIGSNFVNADIIINFDVVHEPPQTPVILTFEEGTSVEEEGLTYTTSIVATKAGRSVIDDIRCQDSQTAINAEIIDSVLHVTRSVTNAITSNVECIYLPENEEVGNLEVKFIEIPTTIGTLHLVSPSVLNGGKSSTKLGGINAVYDQIDLTSSIVCQNTTNVVAQVTSNNELKVTRQTDSEISEYVTCEVAYEVLDTVLVNTSQTHVVFDKINPPGVNLHVPSTLNGGTANTAQYLITANNSNGVDLTSQITCSVISDGNTISIVNHNSPLIVQRETSDKIENGVVRCQVTSGGITEIGNIEVIFDEQETPPGQTVDLYAQSPILGAKMQEAVGTLEAYIVETGADITSSITCENFAQSLIVFEPNLANREFTVQRLTNDSITSAIVRCSVNQPGSTPVTEDIVVNFEQIPGIPVEEPLTISVSPTTLTSQTNTVIAQIEALRGTQNAINDVTCKASSSIEGDVSVDVNTQNARLTVIRNNNDRIQGTIICGDSSSQENITNIPLIFYELETPEIIVLNIPSSINLGTSEFGTFNIDGYIAGQSGFISDEITCAPSSAQISLEHEYVSNKLNLKVSRNSNNEIHSIITCSLRGTSRPFPITFEKIEELEFTLIKSFPGSSLDLGKTSGSTIEIRAENRDLLDITNRVSCESSNMNININPRSPQTLGTDGMLEITRLSNESLIGVVTCTVDDGEGMTDSRQVQIIFDKIVPNEIIPPVREIRVSLDPSRSDIIPGSNPFAFSSGNLVFNVEAPYVGTYRLFMDGIPVKTITHPTLEFEITPDDYLGLNLRDEFDVVVRDETLTSEPLRMRFQRVYQAVVSIIIS